MSADIEGGQAAGKPEGLEGSKTFKAWVREGSPKKDKPNAKWPAGRSKGRTVYARELEGGGCLLVTEEGDHRLAAKFSPPEGKGWVALHEEEGAKPEEKAGNRRLSKAERKELAREGALKRERGAALHGRAEANRARGTREGEGEP